MLNNAKIIEDYEDQSTTNLPVLREQVTELTEVIEALSNIANSSYWKVLKQFVFDVDLEKAKRRLVIEKDTTEIFRLQGEIRWGEKFSLEKLLQDKRSKLEDIRKKINE